jgi:hypothetical protein
MYLASYMVLRGDACGYVLWVGSIACSSVTWRVLVIDTTCGVLGSHFGKPLCLLLHVSPPRFPSSHDRVESGCEVPRGI